MASISRLRPCWGLKTGLARTNSLIPDASCAPVARSNSGRMLLAVDCQMTALVFARTAPCLSLRHADENMPTIDAKLDHFNHGPHPGSVCLRHCLRYAGQELGQGDASLGDGEFRPNSVS